MTERRDRARTSTAATDRSPITPTTWSAATAAARVVRKAIGADLAGTPMIQRVQSTYIRAPAPARPAASEPAWSTLSLNPRRCGNGLCDRRPRDLAGAQLPEAERRRDFERSIAMPASAPSSASAPISNTKSLSKEDWFGRRLVADRFRDRRAFIAGDAAHIWVPYAGYGMNAGIADAMNLSWLLAAHLNGLGAVGILDAYEARALADHRAGVALRDGPCARQMSAGAARCPTKSRTRAGGRAPRARRSGRPPRDQRPAILLRRPQFRLLTTTARRSSPMTAPSSRPIRWRTTRHRPSPGCRLPHSLKLRRRTARSTMHSGRTTRCCASIRI